MTTPQQLTANIPDELAGLRLDQALAQIFPAYSRARLQQWIRAGEVRVDAQQWRGRDKVRGGESVEIMAVLKAEGSWQSEPIALDIVYEDDALLVINKPAGLVVHPGAGNPQGTLLNALLHHAPGLNTVPRAGIVHRLDKETSGLLMVARTLPAQKSLVKQLHARSVQRAYDAVVVGVMTAGGRIEAALGRHPVQRTRMAVTREGSNGKAAITHYRVAQRYRAHTRIRVQLETGRTHQIRAHMAHIRYPIVGDPVYGGRLALPAGCSEALQQALRGFKRQALHAATLGLEHPVTGEMLEWSVPPPADMLHLIKVLEEDAGG
ncbi:MAG: 23S rRNA pseudouridine(1911/1915/1917) synthase RluD [Gammaproteobacteria bacterium]|nr:23S rRNA pseudouridine(1911/1915/1917) synthase RluD [Gammaproteobacteria bacterium]